jgi:CelD/BcsL family acetyltransferase involved in cellulose biosynthesis
MTSGLTMFGISDQRWTSFVEAAPDATPFHRPEWADMLGACYGYRAFALSKVDAQGRICAGIPVVDVRSPFGRRWVSLPFTDYCAPLAQSEEDRNSFVDQLNIERGAQRVSRLEIRALVSGSSVHRRSSSVLHTLRLGADPDVIFRTFKPSAQRSVLKAIRDGVTVRTANTPAELIDTFYGLHARTRARLGIPVQPRRYFRMLWQSLIDRGLGFVLLASTNKEAVAGAVFLAWNGTIEYKYGASIPEFWNLRPNHLLFSTAIRWGCEHGYRVLNFGRTDLADIGLRAFKRSWGAIEEPLVYSTLGEPPRPAHAAALMGLMRPFLRRTPPWVCRVAGELVYRYAA